MKETFWINIYAQFPFNHEYSTVTRDEFHSKARENELISLPRIGQRIPRMSEAIAGRPFDFERFREDFSDEISLLLSVVSFRTCKKKEAREPNRWEKENPVNGSPEFIAFLFLNILAAFCEMPRSPDEIWRCEECVSKQITEKYIFRRINAFAADDAHVRHSILGKRPQRSSWACN